MLPPVDHPHLVPFDGDVRIDALPTAPPDGAPSGKDAKRRLGDVRDTLATLQRRLWADRSRALLVMFQARDAGGKDSTIRHVFRGVNPAGVTVTSFGAPTEREREQDFLWRHAIATPRRGTIGVHNRSWYEEVLVVRVHPALLDGQRQSLPVDTAGFWDRRLESIRDAEHHLARNGTTVVKFFLHVGRDEQARRLLRRLERPDKHWKYDPRDLEERALWGRYNHAYEAAMRQTSRPWAPWYAIPADDKPYMRLTVAQILVQTLQHMDLRWPEPDLNHRHSFDHAIAQLRDELQGG